MIGNKELDQIEARIRAAQEEILQELREMRQERARSEAALSLVHRIARMNMEGAIWRPNFTDAERTRFLEICSSAMNSLNESIYEARRILSTDNPLGESPPTRGEKR